MATVFDVAAYILEKMNAVSHMKLQKLIYYCQAWSLVWDDKPIFQEPIQAWVNGPVVPQLFFSLQGKFTVSPSHLEGKGNVDSLSASEKCTIDNVIAFYGKKDSQWLSDLTHMESPWQEARVGSLPTERSNKEISLASMAEYYGSL